jgi:hypothetical protein
MGTVWSNGQVALTKCLVFGLSVYTEDGWQPWKYLAEEEKELVRRLVDWSPIFPQDIKDILYKK